LREKSDMHASFGEVCRSTLRGDAQKNAIGEVISSGLGKSCDEKTSKNLGADKDFGREKKLKRKETTLTKGSKPIK